jgi:membrane-associated phospholipid phosphatase
VLACSSARRARLAAARLASDLLAPAPVASALVVAVAWRSAPSPAHGARWALLAVACGMLVPVMFLEVGVRLRRLSDRHLSRREERPWPVLVGLVSVLAALRLLALAQAPRDLLALLATMAVVLGVSLGVTMVWKISLHAATLAGSAVVVAVLFGWPWLALAPLLVLVAWARVQLGEHTLGQVLAGSLIGAAGAGLVYGLAL